jgi:hypothetical protein
MQTCNNMYLCGNSNLILIFFFLSLDHWRLNLILQSCQNSFHTNCVKFELYDFTGTYTNTCQIILYSGAVHSESHLGQWLAWRFHGLLQSLQVNARLAPPITLGPPPPLFILIHYSLFVHQYYNTHSHILTASLNEQ